MTAVDRATRCIVGWSVVEARIFGAMQAVVDQIPPTKQFYSDGLSVYRTLIYNIKRLDALHEVAPGKSQTHTVEGVNADLRHYLARLNRKSRCFFAVHPCFTSRRLVVRLLLQPQTLVADALPKPEKSTKTSHGFSTRYILDTPKRNWELHTTNGFFTLAFRPVRKKEQVPNIGQVFNTDKVYYGGRLNSE